MKVISIINLKGGVGKTTTATSLAELLAIGDEKRKRKGSRVLLLDNDKQGNTSQLFEAYNPNEEAAAVRVIKSGKIEEKDLVAAGRGLDLIPCNYFMELAELEIKADAKNRQHDRYKKALAAVSANYDYCVIDNPPDLGMNVINALMATDEIIIPVSLDAYSLDGLEEQMEQIRQLKQLNHKMSVAGCLITNRERTDTAEAAEEWLRKKSGCPVFTTIIRHNKRANDATIYKKTPLRHNPRSGMALDYRKFVQEYWQLYGIHPAAGAKGEKENGKI